jgi:hypothetical protein
MTDSDRHASVARGSPQSRRAPVFAFLHKAGVEAAGCRGRPIEPNQHGTTFGLGLKAWDGY